MFRKPTRPIDLFQEEKETIKENLRLFLAAPLTILLLLSASIIFDTSMKLGVSGKAVFVVACSISPLIVLMMAKCWYDEQIAKLFAKYGKK